MSVKFSFLKSDAAGATPDPAAIGAGELAINFADKLIFTKDYADNVIVIGRGAAASGGASLPADAAGALVNDGAGALTWEDVPTTTAMNTAISTAVGAIPAPAWAAISGKPATFPPALPANAAGHLTNDGSGNLSWAAPPAIPAAPTWSTLAGKPATFAPTIGTTAATAAAGNHTHTWASISGKPAIPAAPAGTAGGMAFFSNASTVTANAEFKRTAAKTYSIASGGKLGVGVAPAQALHVAGQIVATSDATAFYSDLRLKDVESPITGAVAIVKGWDKILYRPNDLAMRIGAADNQELRAGFSVQSIEPTAPHAIALAPFDMEATEDGEVVSKSGQNYRTLKENQLVPYLAAAIDELDERLKRMEKNNVH